MLIDMDHCNVLYVLCNYFPSDHIEGLTRQFPYPIYCTPITARLLRQRFSFGHELLVSWIMFSKFAGDVNPVVFVCVHVSAYVPLLMVTSSVECYIKGGIVQQTWGTLVLLCWVDRSQVPLGNGDVMCRICMPQFVVKYVSCYLLVIRARCP